MALSSLDVRTKGGGGSHVMNGSDDSDYRR
jgi:hypothetical protein